MQTQINNYNKYVKINADISLKTNILGEAKPATLLCTTGGYCNANPEFRKILNFSEATPLITMAGMFQNAEKKRGGGGSQITHPQNGG